MKKLQALGAQLHALKPVQNEQHARCAPDRAGPKPGHSGVDSFALHDVCRYAKIN
jgi:hypothetical protein